MRMEPGFKMFSALRETNSKNNTLTDTEGFKLRAPSVGLFKDECPKRY